MTLSSERLIVALDFADVASAREMTSRLATYDIAFKVGLELFVAQGPRVLDELREAGARRFFLDLKFHDIPNTMAGAVRSAAKEGVWMMNVHASAGSAALKRCADELTEGAGSSGLPRPILIAVTVLTSLDENALGQELGVARPIEQQVITLAKMTQECGLDGVVAPAPDARAIRSACGDAFKIVSPGIRPAGAQINDQARINTPSGAIRDGADYLVVGRPIMQAADPGKACEELLREIGQAILYEPNAEKA